ncbi:xylulokinase [Eubacterium ruminantium]|nr:xylulokinase [Eubacterium ruminantium]
MYIGVDLGTSAVKLLLMDDDGKIVKTISKEYPISFPRDGWSEQNPADWLKQSVAGIKEIAEGYNDRIDGIGVGGQMHGLVCLDENDEVIRPAILWNDGRTEKEVEYLNNVIGRDKLSLYTGNITFAGFTAPKILWMKENEPENFCKIRKIMLPKDYIVYMLTGTLSSDYSDAAGMLLLDTKNKKWSKEMIDICGIKEEMLPKLYDSFNVVGAVKKELSSEMGLRGEIKVVAGAGDNAAAAIGTGACGAGKCNLSLGTSGTIFITSDKFAVDEYNSLHSFCHADGGFHLMGCMLSAASCNKWWMDDILGDSDYAAEQAKMNRLGSNNVFFLPYLMGERSPHNNPRLRAGFLGMRMDTSREDMSLAVLEGVAFGLRDSLEVAKSLGINVTESTICGGGAKSPLWRKIMANVLNINIMTVENDEGPALGGAILAAVGCGHYKDCEDAKQNIIRYTETIIPDAELAARYEERYQTFKKLTGAVIPLY